MSSTVMEETEAREKSPRYGQVSQLESIQKGDVNLLDERHEGNVGIWRRNEQ